MMLDSVQIRRRGALDFEAYYDYACAMQDTGPVMAVKTSLSQGGLDLNGDRIKLVDWTPILNSLSINKQLSHVSIRSCHQPGLGGLERYRPSYRKRVPPFRSKDMTFRLCKAVRDCLSVSPRLQSLQLHSLPLRERDLILLTKGLAKSLSLENLSLAYCPIADEGLEVICQSVKYSSSIKTVDFTGCNLTWRGAEHMANIIKHQATRRHGAAWAESLRYRKPELDGMSGLRRVTLSCNTLIGDRGASALAHELAEDLWVKAVDLQKCGLSNEGARALMGALQSNSTIVVLDIRKNPLVDNALIKMVIERVLVNANGSASQYPWIKLPPSKDTQKPGPRLNAGRGKSSFRIGSRRTSSSGGPSPRAPQTSRPRSAGHVPWRTAARANRQRDLPQGAFNADRSFQGAGSVRVTVETETDSESEEQGGSAQSLQEKITERRYKQLQVELEHCQLRLKEERKARMKADSRLVELEQENKRLRDINTSLSEALHLQSESPGALDDEAVLDSMEISFHKFHAFLDLLKDAGLGQLVSMAGLDRSDLGPLGRGRPASTAGMPGVEEGEREEAASMGNGRICGPSGNQTDDFLYRGPVGDQAHDPRRRRSASVTEELGQQREPSSVLSPAEPRAGSHGNGLHGSVFCSDASLRDASRKSSLSERDRSLGSRASRERGSEGSSSYRSGALEKICPFGSLGDEGIW